MLLELKVSQFAIIDNIHIKFGPGLNIMSGETGAGKSVLLKSLSLLMGLKGSVESIRTGFDQASIEGSFDLSDRGDLKKKLKDLQIPVEDDLFVVRRVLSEGKSRVYLNGVLSTLNTLRDLVAPLIEVAGSTAPLIEMTGQFENRNLTSKAYHLDILDQYSENMDLRSEYNGLYQDWLNTQKEIQELLTESRSQNQRLDFLRYQRDEISALDLNPGEDLEIEAELRKLKSVSKLVNFVTFAESALTDDEASVTQALHQVMQKAQEVQNLDPSILEKCQSFSQAKTLIEDGLYELRSYLSKMEANPERLEELESRLSSIRKLQKKFGPNLDDIIKSLVEMEIEISRLENLDEHVKSLEAKVSQLEKSLRKIAQQLHERRGKTSKKLADHVNAELKDLNMKGVQFHVEVGLNPELGPSGLSDVEFQTQSAPQEPKRPLAKVASGGELSRILLSLKKVVGSGPYPRTFLFDEVDTGVSGPTAEKVGRKLKGIGQDQQVICVTHLPQVAAFADLHFRIEKQTSDKGTSKSSGVAMEVSKLSSKDRIQEIARLISGEKVTKTSLAHAEQLLKEAHP